jgi:ketosteroid isomerase-like protein
MRFIPIFLLIILFIAANVYSSDEVSERTSSSAGGNEIKILEAKWSDLFGARDLEGIMALMARNSVLIMPGSAPIVGSEGIRRATEAMLESNDAVSWQSEFAFIAPSGDMAYDYGRALTKSADGTSIEGYYLVVWFKENGEWKVAADMFN